MATQTIPQLFDLSGKVAIVTGGASGIGQGIAFRLAEAGANVMISDIDLDSAHRTADQIKAVGGRVQTIYADAGSVQDTQKTVQATLETFGRLDILVNNAGFYPFRPLFDIDEEIWDRVLNVNLKGVFFYSQAAAREMIRGGRGGKIINLASTRSFHPALGLAHYSASKAGVVMLTKSLALELASHSITVNAVAPGGIITPGTGKAGAEAVQVGSMSMKEISSGFQARLPLSGKREPDDIARVVLFLASSASDYMTGSVLVADAGYLLS